MIGLVDVGNAEKERAIKLKANAATVPVITGTRLSPSWRRRGGMYGERSGVA